MYSPCCNQASHTITMSVKNPVQETVVQALSVPGLTKDGAAWLGKSLHPSDSVLPVQGVPTMDAVPTAALNFMTTTTIAAPGSGAWTADVFTSPSPINFAKVVTGDGTAYGTTTIHNTQLGVTTAWSEFGSGSRSAMAAYELAWANSTKKYRLMYASTTITLSASATTDQGSVTCAQYEQPSAQLSGMTYLDLTTPDAGQIKPALVVQGTIPDTATLQGIPGSVTWEARKGMYSVLKLGSDLSEWRSSRDTRAIYFGAAGCYGLVPGEVKWAYSNFASNVTNLNGATAASASDVWYGPQGCSGYYSIAGTGATLVAQTTGAAQYPPCSEMSQIRFTGLDPAASLCITVRVGFECIVQPTSLYIGQVGAPTEYDPVALKTYYAVSRQMLAGYPAEYNAFGALFNVIKGLATRAAPVVGRMVKGAFDAAVGPTSTTVNQMQRVLAPTPPPTPKAKRQRKRRTARQSRQ